MLPTLAVSWRASALRSEEARHLRQVAGVSIVAVRCLHSVVDISAVESRVA